MQTDQHRDVHVRELSALHVLLTALNNLFTARLTLQKLVNLSLQCTPLARTLLSSAVLYQRLQTNTGEVLVEMQRRLLAGRQEVLFNTTTTSIYGQKLCRHYPTPSP